MEEVSFHWQKPLVCSDERTKQIWHLQFRTAFVIATSEEVSGSRSSTNFVTTPTARKIHPIRLQEGNLPRQHFQVSCAQLLQRQPLLKYILHLSFENYEI